MSTLTRRLVIGVILFAAGCEYDRGSLSEEERRLLAADFLNGRIELTCQLLCPGAMGWEAARLHEIYDRGNWEQLSREVIRIGYPSDLSYYYLGRAAEGLGATPAARAYYTKVLEMSKNNNDTTCEWWAHPCQSVDLPALARAGLERL